MPSFDYQWWVYIVLCCDSTLYTGITTDLSRRIDQHNSGKGAKYTSGRSPVRLLWSKQFVSEGEARQFEARVKKWGKLKKHALIQGKIYSD